ncbi:hypothetical protein HK104_005490 [Borealophlyctis nickersoniae]|nr:hypothetical protein HK104_005490 [Borealophlyctis nickersoniae]
MSNQIRLLGVEGATIVRKSQRYSLAKSLHKCAAVAPSRLFSTESGDGADSRPVVPPREQYPRPRYSKELRGRDSAMVKDYTPDDLRRAVRVGNAKEAHTAYRYLQRSRQLQGLTVNDWNLLIRLLRRAHVVWGRAADRKSKALAFMKYVDEMKGNGVEPDTSTYVTLASTWAYAGDVERTKFFLQEIERKGLPPSRVTAVLLATARAWQGDNVEEVLKEVEIILRGASSGIYGIGHVMGAYNSVLESCANRRDAEGYMRCLEFANTFDLKPDGATFDFMINLEAVARQPGNLEEAKRLLEQKVRLGYGRTTRAYNSLLQGNILQGQHDEALKIFEEMEKNNVPANVETYNNMLVAYDRLDDPTAALRTYLAMLVAHVSPTRSTHKRLTSALARHLNDPDDLKNLITAAGGFPSKSLYRAVIKGATELGNADVAFLILNDYQREHAGNPLRWPLNTEMYNALFDLLGKSVGRMGETEGLLKDMEMHGLVPNLYTFNSIVTGYTIRRNRDVPGHKEAVRRLLEKARGDWQLARMMNGYSYSRLLLSVWLPWERLNDEAIEYLKDLGQQLEMGRTSSLFSLESEPMIAAALKVVGNGDIELGLERIKKGDVENWGTDPLARRPEWYDAAVSQRAGAVSEDKLETVCVDVV